MPIDWFTVAAQVVNFLILVWLLKRFLYKPILKAVDAREARIAKERADADAIRTAAEAARADLRKKTEAFDQDRAERLQKVAAEAAGERQRLLAEAQAAADTLTARRARALQTEAEGLSQALTRRAQDEVFAIAGKALTDLADVSLQDRVCAVFLQRLTELEAGAKTALTEAARAGDAAILVRSAFDLTGPQQAALQSALQEALSTKAALTFEVAPDLVSGIELGVGGQKLAWNIAAYLSGLAAQVEEVIKARDRPDAEAVPQIRKAAGA
ncbi:F0F1 ATP synthase subunit B [bacterium]|nr:F0F1 ATP synthase subunit B [bacterium]